MDGRPLEITTTVPRPNIRALDLGDSASHNFLLMLAILNAFAAAPLPYCNVAMDTGRIPPLPPATTLVQVQVLIRHGSRTPAGMTGTHCWAGEELATFDCTATLLEAPDASRPSGVHYSKHYSRGRNKLPGNCMIGQLVRDGLEMCRMSGRHLRTAYRALLPASPVGNEDAFHLRSDDVPRTLASGQALFAAMYENVTSGPGSGPAPVTWHTMDSGSDSETLLPSHLVCPAHAAAFARAVSAWKQSAHFANVTTPLAKQMSSALNRTVEPMTIGEFVDCIGSVSCPTVPRVAGGLPPKAFTPDLQRRVMQEGGDGLYGILNDTDVARFGAGPLIGEILISMEAAAASTSSVASAPVVAERAAGGAKRGGASPSFPKFALWSGHDTGPMAPVLAALKIGGAEFPRFNDLISIELHRESKAEREAVEGEVVEGEEPPSNLSVRVVHNGMVVTHLVDGCPPNAQLCDFRTFHATAASLVPTPSECGRKDAPAWWPAPTKQQQRPSFATL